MGDPNTSINQQTQHHQTFRLELCSPSLTELIQGLQGAPGTPQARCSFTRAGDRAGLFTPWHGAVSLSWEQVKQPNSTNCFTAAPARDVAAFGHCHHLQAGLVLQHRKASAGGTSPAPWSAGTFPRFAPAAGSGPY